MRQNVHLLCTCTDNWHMYIAQIDLVATVNVAHPNRRAHSPLADRARLRLLARRALIVQLRVGGGVLRAECDRVELGPTSDDVPGAPERAAAEDRPRPRPVARPPNALPRTPQAPPRPPRVWRRGLVASSAGSNPNNDAIGSISVAERPVGGRGAFT